MSVPTSASAGNSASATSRSVSSGAASSIRA